MRETTTSRERIERILRRQPVDRIGVFEHFWGDTIKQWTDEGHIRAGESLEDHFGFDLMMRWAFNFTAKLDFVPETVEETDETILTRDGNDAILPRFTPERKTPFTGRLGSVNKLTLQ